VGLKKSMFRIWKRIMIELWTMKNMRTDWRVDYEVMNRVERK
jgi:hypothetical protein